MGAGVYQVQGILAIGSSDVQHGVCESRHGGKEILADVECAVEGGFRRPKDYLKFPKLSHVTSAVECTSFEGFIARRRQTGHYL
jgi:hypothetical protein